MDNSKTNILIADSGSTKTDWAFNGHIMSTQGINPIHQDDATICAILTDELLPQLSNGQPSPSEIHFYGSGVRPEHEPRMTSLLRKVFPQALIIEAKSDLLGAARALCGDGEGIACILGTGANSCLYDGSVIVQNTPPLGYILGDEGSGAVLGVKFLNALYKDRLPSHIREAFEAEWQVTLADVINTVYRQPMPNRWLASLSKFICQHLDEPEVEALVVDNFRSFLRRNVSPYHRPDLPVSAVGSIAYFYQDQLRQAVASEGYTLGTVLRSPITQAASATNSILLP